MMIREAVVARGRVFKLFQSFCNNARGEGPSRDRSASIRTGEDRGVTGGGGPDSGKVVCGISDPCTTRYVRAREDRSYCAAPVSAVKCLDALGVGRVYSRSLVGTTLCPDWKFGCSGSQGGHPLHDLAKLVPSCPRGWGSGEGTELREEYVYRCGIVG